MAAFLDIPSTPGLVSLVYAGNSGTLAKFLANYPQDTPLIWAAEPYTNIQGKRKAKCLQMLCDDPRFQFDHLFISRMFYFSTKEVHEILYRHPRFKNLMKDTKSFMEFFWKNYPGGQTAFMGMSQRYIQAERVITYIKKKDNTRVAFFLYPFLVSAGRKFIERHYAPGGKGYLKTKAEFESLC
jgi:hypothetical protein